MSITKAAAMLGVSRSLLHDMVRRGELTVERNPLYRKHSRVGVPLSEVERLRAILTAKSPQ